MSRCCTTLLVLVLTLLPLAARALSTAFLYQGRLAQAGAAPTGSFDFTFALYDAATGGAQVGGTVSLNGVAVANGRFAAPLDFGAVPFAGADRWLEIAVRATGGPSYAVLAPRQPLAPTPYALFAKAVNWDDILNRPAAFGVYTAGPGLTLAGQQFAIAAGGVDGAMLASDAAGLAKVSGGIMSASPVGVTVGTTGVPDQLFQVFGAASIPMGVSQLLRNGSLTGGQDIWQSFTAPADTTLAALEVQAQPTATTTAATLTLYGGEGVGGAVLASRTVTVAAGPGARTFVLAPPVALAAGVQYTFAITGVARWDLVTFHTGNPYAGGRCMLGSTTDLVFTLYSALGTTARAALFVDRHSLNVGIDTITPGFPLTFASILGDKIALWGANGPHYGFGVQSALLQIHTDVNTADIAFGCGSSAAFAETVRLKGTGEVGIGTSSPAAKLEVNGTAKMTGFQLGASATAGQVLTANASGVGTWQALPTAPTTLPPSGAAGGDLAGTYPNPTVGAGRIDTTRLADNAVTAAKILNGTIAAADLADNAVTAAKLASDPASLAKVSNNSLRMNGTNVGIGTSAAGFPLGFATALGDKIALWGDSGAHYGLGVQNALLQVHADNANSSIAFGYGSSAAFTELMRITGAGNVGIGTAAPGYKLHVNGSVAGVGAYQSLSDARFKTNVRPLAAALARLGRLRGVEFDWKRDGACPFALDDRRQLGFLAQEVAAVVPEAVTQGPDGVYSLADTALIPLLVEGVKEQQGTIAALQADNAALRNLLAALAARVQALEERE